MQLRRGLNCGKIWVLAYFPVFGDLGISLSFWGLFFFGFLGVIFGFLKIVNSFLEPGIQLSTIK